MRAPDLRRAVGVAVALACVVAAPSGCRRRHVDVSAIPELGYPACLDGGVDEHGVTIARGHLRSGPSSEEKNVVERFELDKTSCGYTFHARQEWPLDISDVEVRYDASLSPIWVWKRMTIAGAPRPDGNADIRRYELRTGEVFIKRRDAGGEITLQKLLPGGRISVPEGARVGAVVGPGRGVITAWLRRARLPVGGTTYDLVLDFRSLVETLEMGTLERQPDLYEPSYGKKVRVYTFFGRETVFADDDDVVIGDLAGMRPSHSLKTPEPPPLPTYGGADPVHTP
jgi:hypothetical protein